jgi:hypothetical protein
LHRIASKPLGSPNSTSIWPASAAPASPRLTSSPLTVGLKFESTVSGYISGIRFYNGASSASGPEIGLFYNSGGTLLAQATFSAATSAGWQQVNFSTPVAIVANTVYVAAYFSTTGFAYTGGYFTSAGFGNPPLQALEDGASGYNSVYIYGSTAQFPTNDGLGANYWVDVAFSLGTAATPAFSPASGNYASAQSVTLSTSTSGATIRYTTDGSTPSETHGTVYSGGITVSSTQTLQAIAYETNWADSSVASATYTIAPPTLTSVSVSPSTVISTNSATITVTLSGAAPSGGAVVTLSTSSASAFAPPASITVAAGQTAGSATVAAGTVSTSTGVTVTGNYGGAQTGSITVLPLPTLTSVSVSPSTVTSTNSTTVTVTLSSAAPSGGAVVTLSTSSASAFSAPASITVPAGQTSAVATGVALILDIDLKLRGQPSVADEVSIL